MKPTVTIQTTTCPICQGLFDPANLSDHFYHSRSGPGFSIPSPCETNGLSFVATNQPKNTIRCLECLTDYDYNAEIIRIMHSFPCNFVTKRSDKVDPNWAIKTQCLHVRGQTPLQSPVDGKLYYICKHCGDNMEEFKP